MTLTFKVTATTGADRREKNVGCTVQTHMKNYYYAGGKKIELDADDEHVSVDRAIAEAGQLRLWFTTPEQP